MRMSSVRSMMRGMMVVAVVALVIPGADGRPCLGGGAEPRGGRPTLRPRRTTWTPSGPTT